MQAYINPYLFILARTPHQVVWDYLHHAQFELDLAHCQHLTQTLQLFIAAGFIDA